MSKKKIKYVCQNCGYIAPKWMGKCPECNEWNSLVEDISTEDNFKNINVLNEKPIKLSEVSVVKEDRFTTKISEMDLTLGGGIVKGSLVLVGGDPGIGKSTLLLQVASNVSLDGKRVLYVSGEESMKQIKFRADRLGIDGNNIFIMSENNMDVIKKYVEDIEIDLLIVDSVQTVYNPEVTSSPGSVSQVREVTNDLMRISKGSGIATFLVGHVTKNGAIAGPKVLEHMVDTVLYFEGEKSNIYRILRAVKNRFGSTNEIGLFEMTSLGLKEVDNPSKLFLSNNDENSIGSITIATMEGTRSVLVEIQSLISSSSFSSPRRMAIGVDYNKIVMIMAVLEKRLGMMLGDQDAYVNVVGGIVINEPAADLAIAVAIASSFRNVKISKKLVVLGEIGLTGEVRAVNHVQQRIVESNKLGFEEIIVPRANLEGVIIPKGIKVYGVKNIEEAFSVIF